MVYDANPLPSGVDALAELLKTTLEDWRAKEDLSASPLAACPLVYDCLLTGETPQRHVLTLNVQALLRWAIDQLWPMTQPDKSDTRWKKFASLHYPYVQGLTLRETGEQMGLEDQTVRYWQPGARQEIAQTLLRELDRLEYQPQRKRCALAERYGLYQQATLDSADEQRLLRFCAMLRHPMPLAKLKPLAQQIGVANPQACLDRLWLDGWLTQEGEQLLTIVRDEDARRYLRSRLAENERRDWSALLAEEAAKAGAHLTAADYWCAGDHFEQAATYLITHFQAVINAGEAHALLVLREKIGDASLTPDTLARLQIAAGRAALTIGEIDQARRRLGNALQASNAVIKAEAYYYLGKSYEKGFIHEAAQCFQRGIELLQRLPPAPKQTELARKEHDALLANLYIGKAQLMISHASDPTVAEEPLRQAEAIISTMTERGSDLTQALINLHNALAGYYQRRDDRDNELRHSHRAVIFARELGDKERLWGMVQNLAHLYIDARHYEVGLALLTEAETLVLAIGSQGGIGKCLQTRGAYHFFQSQDQRQAGLDGQAELTQAIDCYRRSIAVFATLGNLHWLAAAYADLTEAYVAWPNLPLARRYYLDAIDCARRAGIEDVIRQLLTALEENHPELAVKNLSERELFTLQLTKERGSMTSGELMRLAEIGESTAERMLRKLKDLGLLKMDGKGRNTKYRLPSAAP